MPSFTRTQIFNRNANCYANVQLGGPDDEAAIAFAIEQTGPMNKDVVELQEAEVELVKQGEAMISGSFQYRDRMVQKVASTKTLKTGTVKIRKGILTVAWN